MALYQIMNADGSVVVRIADNVSIPPDPENRDRARYDQERADWLAGGNPIAEFELPYVPVPPPPATVNAIAWSAEYKAANGPVPVVNPQATSNGVLGWDIADIPNATAVVMSQKNAQGVEITTVFAVAMQPGRVLRIETAADSTSFVSHNIVECDVDGDVLLVHVTPRAHGGTAHSSNTPLTVAVYEVFGAPPEATRQNV
jgi:hypothetical protein